MHLISSTQIFLSTAFIEKNAWAGMEDWNVNITRALLEECEVAAGASGSSLKKSKKKAGKGAGSSGAKMRRGGGSAVQNVANPDMHGENGASPDDQGLLDVGTAERLGRKGMLFGDN